MHRRAGAAEAGDSPAARTVLRGAGIGAPLVPVPVGYRTSGVAPTVGGHRGRAGRAVVRCCGGVVPLQPDVSRRLTAEGECVTGGVRPQCVAPVACLTLAAVPPERGGGGAPTVGG